jgi:hypothetical protein
LAIIRIGALVSTGWEFLKVNPDSVLIATEGTRWGRVSVGGSDTDRDGRLPGLGKSGDTLKVLFSDYLGARPAVTGGQALPAPSELMLSKTRSPFWILPQDLLESLQGTKLCPGAMSAATHYIGIA